MDSTNFEKSSSGTSSKSPNKSTVWLIVLVCSDGAALSNSPKPSSPPKGSPNASNPGSSADCGRAPDTFRVAALWTLPGNEGVFPLTDDVTSSEMCGMALFEDNKSVDSRSGTVSGGGFGATLRAFPVFPVFGGLEGDRCTASLGLFGDRMKVAHCWSTWILLPSSGGL